MKQLILYIVLTFLLFSCAQKFGTTTDGAYHSSPPKEENILAFTLEFKKNSADLAFPSITLNDYRLISAYLKKDFETAPVIPKEKYRVSLANADNVIIKSIIVEDPLRTYLEYPNENHEFERKLVLKDVAFVSLRARYEKAIKYILIENVDSNQNPGLFVKINLIE